MRATLIAVGLASAALASLLHAQGGDLPAFEVASIKPRIGEPASNVSSPPDRFISPDATLLSLIRYAYNVEDFQVSGGPDWVSSRRFDVSAKAGDRPSQDEMRLMLRRLLAERFALRTHTESRQMPTYALVKAKADGQLGTRLRPSAIDCPAILAARGLGFRPPAPGEPLASCAWRVGLTKTIATMMLDGAPLSQFATIIQQMVRRIVVDQTGLAGTFDIQLEFSMEQMGLPFPLPPDAPAPPPRDGLSIFTALEEQLGLKLESKRGPVEVIVIDHAEPPTPD